MKLLSDILKGVKSKQIIGDSNIQINLVCFDSRKVQADDIFVATRGSLTDGHNYIEKALELGAKTIVCEELPSNINKNICYILVHNSSEALGLMASNYFGNPSSKLNLVGITGTNGKTTTVTLLYKLFKELGYKVGLLSTISNYVDIKVIDSTHTTPDAISLNSLLNEMVYAGCEYCFMEVSSHAIAQHRITGLVFKGGIFSNITHDHLDYHKTFSEYLKAKKTFFDNLSASAFALTNVDDRNGKIMLQNTHAVKYSYALKSVADFKIKIIESHFDGMQLNVEGIDVWTSFIGKFNAYNLLAIYSAGVLLNQDKKEILTILSKLKSVNGRFETLRSKNNVTFIVDYAHTPDALENVLNTISEIRNGNENLITVIGAGGNRDKTKRPIMARIAAEKSNKVILTSDNPRNEEPESILNEMYEGVEAQNARKVIRITDRREAIKTACLIAEENDIVLVAGKGHETYQEIKGIKHHFDDKEIINENIN
ncbi:MAG: UDP-N-acetylmuramoyl-L-alanyl-D-glutamate--2,6-diaminopimelate ligase [Bacteroidetes bacterium GWF2_33_38]|nr:MAG: UDP-N-acetylmuramoyl-L-alanyl-D-glutamate--2,6-diaminopimelate ligase [Bacteroidetes bacterium GWF2_33_38]OFY73503.1 MAG: UDP-N-acetylmuramoyl-L-alanyl-D-glutamate--2,6-diaminopimelate ligase [Bacteroidetes bacterium RIFOXYA12_FULL_33_9]OFY88931.1 MAG: UDP-N-acetylmuramoyl-L-alanyl-D-glutamate--2,6-diaminopimelate ligase [Bacteroidetes bacterium RIFOXYA2_FULL_33_7]